MLNERIDPNFNRRLWPGVTRYLFAALSTSFIAGLVRFAYSDYRYPSHRRPRGHPDHLERRAEPGTKKALYKAIAGGLHAAVGLRREDVFVNLIEVRKENWSFGNGEAQYAIEVGELRGDRLFEVTTRRFIDVT
jgi:phenylpyruvate tautomerase PptA (4-oxalocrotonate tautomerase family)